MAKDSISITLEAREVTGKAVKHLRRDGFVPAVIHDHGKASVLVQGEYLDLYRVYRAAGKHHPIELKTPQSSYMVLIKDAVFEPRKNRLTHLVFNAVDKNQKVEAEVPVQAKYADEENQSTPAERSGLIVLSQLEAIEVKAVPDKIPNAVYYDAEKLVEIGDRLTVADLTVPPEIEVLTDPNHAVVTVFEPSALAAANEEAAGAATAEEAEGNPDEGDSAEGLTAEKQAEQADEPKE